MNSSRWLGQMLSVVGAFGTDYCYGVYRSTGLEGTRSLELASRAVGII